MSSDTLTQESSAVATLEPASFRDRHSGFVFWQGKQPLRQINHAYRPHYELLHSSGLYASLLKQGYLLPQTESSVAPLEPEHAWKVLSAERLPFISYPHEWCFSQFKDAALLTLALEDQALQHGQTLKDASAFNIQFCGAKPLLLDALSFERYQAGSPWQAYRQFCQHFLLPLALARYADPSVFGLLLRYPDGLPLELARLLPLRTQLRPGLLMHLHLHRRMQLRSTSQASAPAKSVRQRSLSLTARRGLVDSLRSAISGLHWSPPKSTWSHYYQETNYSDAAMRAKQEFVEQVTKRLRPESVWDLGANTGRFSEICARQGAKVVAFDFDHSAIEILYQRSKSTSLGILPLVQDLSNPTPSYGWEQRERSSLQARGPAALVLALALVHHLAIGHNLPLARILRYLLSLGEYLLIEFVPKQDSQTQRLLATREDIFADYTQERFESYCSSLAELVERFPVPGTERCLYLLRG
jgi:hypothetical protein